MFMNAVNAIVTHWPQIVWGGLTAGVLLTLLLAATTRVPTSYNLRNLTVRWRTTLLTALAFTLVISMLTGMRAFVNGMIALTEQSGEPGNVILLSQGTTEEQFSDLGFSDVADIESQPIVERNARGEPLCSRETFLVVNAPVQNPPPGRPKRRFLQVRGLDDPQISAEVHGMELVAGDWFSAQGARRIDGADAAQGDTAIEAVIGEGIARELGRDRTREEILKARNRDRLDVGDTFVLGERTWIVVGVMKSEGSIYGSEVWAKRGLIGPLLGKETYSSLVIRTRDAAAASRAKTYYTTEYTKARLNALTEKEYFSSLNSTTTQFLVSILFVTLVMALGGVAGVMNTMYAAVSARRQDVGALRILGFSRTSVLVSFVLESIIIAVLGGALGCAIGNLADGWTANSIAGGQGGGKFIVLRTAVTWLTLGEGMLLSLVMGGLGGFFPALSAMWLRPLEAMR